MVYLLLGMLPPIALLLYVYHLDKVEKEPPKLILRLFLLGIFSVIPAVFLEAVGEALLSRTGLAETSIPYLLIEYFIIVALAEELSKRMIGVGMTYKSEEFNYQFDAIVYCVAAALGFAAIENVGYLVAAGTGAFFGRLIPIHAICGVFMGHYVGMAKSAHREGNTSARIMFNFLSVLVPVLIHGFYDFSLSTEYDEMILLNLLFTLVLTIVAFISLRSYAKNDKPV